MRLPTLGDQYSGAQMRELVRLLELALNRNAATGGGSAAALSNSNPANLGSPSPGASGSASRADHVHRLPSAGDVGADPAGAASGAIAAHVAATNPHPQYEQFPFSTVTVGEGETLTVPEALNLLLTRRGLDVRGALDLRGAVVDTNPDAGGGGGGGECCIISIERTSGDGSPGTVDVYTITYTGGEPTTFTVYNGADGEPGVPGPPGPPGPPTPAEILELTSDPVSPANGDAWVLKTVENPAGTLQSFVGGVTQVTAVDDNMYQFSYKTVADGIKRVALT